MSYKVGCKTTDGGPWAYNALRFATQPEALDYAKDLYSRWLMLKEYEIHESEDVPNYAWANGTYERLEV